MPTEERQRYRITIPDSIKRIEEQTNGEVSRWDWYPVPCTVIFSRFIEALKGKLGKNVLKGTPLTLYMARLYKEKYGKDALDIAKKNGYTVPTVEEFRLFRERPPEFREGLVE